MKTATRWRAIGAACLGLTFILPACSGPEVVLATIPAGNEAGANTYIRCGDTADCPTGLYCDKPACNAEAGTCEFFPGECDDAPSTAVCGCDGVTYFSDCLRKGAGIAASTPGECSLPAASTCGGSSNTACPTGLYCAQLLGMGSNACGVNVRGTCWSLPSTCPTPTPGPDQWIACQGGGACLDTCSAIQAGGVFARAQSCREPGRATSGDGGSEDAMTGDGG
jgi:hypothetical protein